MINDIPARTKWTIVCIVTAVFVSSAVFAYIMLTDASVTEDESKTLMYAAVFAAILIILNAALLVIGLRASRKARERTSEKCTSCGAVIDADATECPQCGALHIRDDMYLEPKPREDKRKIRPKK